MPLGGGADAPPVARRRLLLGGAWHDAPVFDVAAPVPDQRRSGPAILESDTTTVRLRCGDVARMDAARLLDIAVG